MTRRPSQHVRRDRARASSRAVTSGCTSAGSARYGDDHEVPIIAARRGLLRVGRARQALPRRARRASSPCSSATVAPTSPQAAATQAETLEYFPIWTLRAPAGDRAGRPRSPSSRPATSTGCSSPPAAPRRSSRRGSSPASTSGRSGEGQRYKVIARADRVPRHDARRARDHRRARRCATPFEPLTPGHVARRQHQPLPPPARRRREGVHARGHRRDRGGDPLRGARDRRRRLPRAGAERGRLLRPARRATSQRVREICDRYGVLLVSDEVICAFGRLGDVVRRASATTTCPT